VSTAAIQVRRPALELGPDVPRYWYGGEPFATHYLDALSSVFPDGEAFFVRSVQRYRDRVDDPELQRAILGFAGQEGQHSQQHDRHLELLAAHGYGALARMNRVGDRMMRFANRHAPRFALASTAALEHLTALLARRILEDGSRFTTAMDPRMGALWRWHALEEAEHKTVAFDVLQRVAPSYLLRALALISNTGGLFVEMLLRTAYMLWKDGELTRGGNWSDGWVFLFGREGLLRGMGRDYRAWYRRDFHPSQIDDRALIEAWRTRVAPRESRA
jgi:predicted metal-dependent hydrolase